MKNLIFNLLLLILFNIPASAQQWVQTASIPEGAGITDIIVAGNGTLFVTTASYSSIAGTLGGVRRSTNDGQSWENLLSGFNGRTLHLGDNGVVFASFWPFPLEEAIYRSTNDGDNWIRLRSVNTGDNIFSITSKDNNNTIFIGTRNGVQRSTNAGVNWSYVNNGIPANSWVRDIETDTSSGIIVAATTNGVFSTTNNGGSWLTATGIDPQDTIVKIMFNYPFPESDNLEETRAVFGSDDGALYYSFRKSDYTSLVLTALFADYETTGLVECLIRGQNTRFRGVAQFGMPNNEGGFRLSIGEGDFKMNNEGLPNQTLPSALSYYVKTIIDGADEITFFLGSFENTIDGAKVYKLTYLVAIQQISSEVPEGFKLKQNYPNPFNPETKIKFDIANKNIVKLIVYNLLGQEIATLVNESLFPGSYEYIFDGTGLTSGVYFYKLQAENFSEIKKMLLVK
jgi:hypothetical protein